MLLPSIATHNVAAAPVTRHAPQMIYGHQPQSFTFDGWSEGSLESLRFGASVFEPTAVTESEPSTDVRYRRLGRDIPPLRAIHMDGSDISSLWFGDAGEVAIEEPSGLP